MIPFSLVQQHAEQVRQGDPGGRLVLSKMHRGESRVFCATPSLKYVLEGEERYLVDGVEHVVLPGQFLLVEAGVILSAVIRPTSVTTGMCLYLKQDPILPFVDLRTAEEECVRAEPPAGRAVVLSASGTALGEHLKSGALALARDPERGQGVAARIVHDAAAHLHGVLSDVRLQLSNLDAIKGSTSRDLLRRLDIARAWLWDNDDRIVPLDELSRKAGISQFHLHRCFKAAFGTAPASYHRQQRLQKAAASLRRGELNAAGAAARFGFCDESSLRRAFKRSPDLHGDVHRVLHAEKSR